MPKFRVWYVVQDYDNENAIGVEAIDFYDAMGRAIIEVARADGFSPEEITVTRVERVAEKGVSDAHL